MKHSVVLVQRGISSPTHPVCGKSGKTYGMAAQSSMHNGVVHKMSQEDYERDAHDIVGNTLAGQQWIPTFITAPGGGAEYGTCSSPSCGLGPNGGAAEASYAVGTSLFCPGHAPRDAKPLYEGAPAIFRLPPPEVVADDFPAATPLPESKAETFAPPFAGSAEEEASLGAPRVETPEPIPAFPKTTGTGNPPVRTVFSDPAGPAPIQTPEPIPAFPPPTPKASNEAPATASVSPAGASVLDAIKTEVEKQVNKMENTLVNTLKGVIQSAVDAAIKPKAPGLQGRRDTRPPTEFQLLQQKAKELGIEIFQKGKAQLEAEIDAKSNGTPEGAPEPFSPKTRELADDF